MTWTNLRSALAPRTKTVEIAWREAGHGPPVLLLHGVGLNADAWEPQIVGLSPHRRVIAADLPGHGQSEPLPEGSDLSDHVAAMAVLIDALGISPLPVIGHSMGAMIALGLALGHPAKITGLVTLNAVYCRDAQARAAVEGRAARMSGGSIDVLGPIGRWFPDDPTGPLARHSTGWLRQMNPKEYAAAYRIFATSDHVHKGRLGKLECRALFMTGVSDPNSTPVMSDRMAREAPNGRSVALPGARHMMHLTHHAEVTSIIAAFLEATQTPRK